MACDFAWNFFKTVTSNKVKICPRRVSLRIPDGEKASKKCPNGGDPPNMIISIHMQSRRLELRSCLREHSNEDILIKGINFLYILLKLIFSHYFFHYFGWRF